jgi:hypothetical protein
MFTNVRCSRRVNIADFVNTINPLIRGLEGLCFMYR